MLHHTQRGKDYTKAGIAGHDLRILHATFSYGTTLVSGIEQSTVSHTGALSHMCLLSIQNRAKPNCDVHTGFQRMGTLPNCKISP